MRYSLWHRISPQGGVGFFLQKDESLKVMTPQGAQVSDLFCVSSNDTLERYSSLRTLDYNDGIQIKLGGQLYSNRSSPMLTLLEDTCQRHDLLMPPCSLKMFQIVSQTTDYHPSCHENLSLSLAQWGVGEDSIDSSFNIFMNVHCDEHGRVEIRKPQAQAQDYVVFKAEMDLYIALTACSHEETNNGLCTEILYQILPSTVV